MCNFSVVDNARCLSLHRACDDLQKRESKID